MASLRLFSLGNPLLDHVLDLSDGEHSDWVSRFGLEAHVPQEADTLASGMLQAVNQFEKERSVSLAPGGCALNTSRVVKHLSRHSSLRKKKNNDHSAVDVVFAGSVGNDASAERLRELIHSDGVETKFYAHSDYPTGHCIGLASGVERTLAANVGAARHFDLKNFNALRLGEDQSPLLSATLVYTTGFFACHSWPAVIKTAALCRDAHIPFAFNLSGEYVCRDKGFVRELLAVLPDVRILFGNRSEMGVLIETLRSLDQNAFADLFTSATSSNHDDDAIVSNDDKPRLVLIVTDGPNPVHTAEVDVGRMRVGKRGVHPVSAPKVVRDTVGAGDSFAAGFLMGFMDSMPLEDCLNGGIRAAHLIMSQPGTKLPEE